MNYETEPWYKLYIRESTEDKLLPVLNRALRDFLLRLAKSREDGTILNRSAAPGEDIARAMGADPSEASTIAAYVGTMLKDGFLSHRRGRVWITQFVEAQAARSAGAKRQEKWRANGGDSSRPKRDGHETKPETQQASPGDVSVASLETSLSIRSEERREDPKRDDPDAREVAAPPPSQPRTDPFAESLTTPDDELPEGWQPTDPNRALAAQLGLDVDEERGMHAAHRRRQGFRCGAWDDDFELWLRRSAKQRRERQAKRGGGTATHGGPSDEWPTESDLSLREAIRSGAHGIKLKAKLDAGQLDAALARRLVREREAERRDRLPTIEAVAGDVASLTAGIGRRLE